MDELDEEIETLETLLDTGFSRRRPERDIRKLAKCKSMTAETTLKNKYMNPPQEEPPKVVESSKDNVQSQVTTNSVAFKTEMLVANSKIADLGEVQKLFSGSKSLPIENLALHHVACIEQSLAIKPPESCKEVVEEPLNHFQGDEELVTACTAQDGVSSANTASDSIVATATNAQSCLASQNTKTCGKPYLFVNEPTEVRYCNACNSLALSYSVKTNEPENDRDLENANNEKFDSGNPVKCQEFKNNEINFATNLKPFFGDGNEVDPKEADYENDECEAASNSLVNESVLRKPKDKEYSTDLPIDELLEKLKY